MVEFELNNKELLRLVNEWELRLLSLPEEVIGNRRNIQNRTIKQIVGHMVDSASNNTHRIIHLQYNMSPLIYPDYANLGNNDRWIAIQNYQDENWENLVQLWKYSNLHIAHVIDNVNPEKQNNEWISALQQQVSLKAMILDYLSHFKLHLNEIEDLINSK
ncbi:MAG: DinB family protein [Paludibacter sp.]|nr:DinB family protein [Paludibacter sp.]